MRVSSEQSPGDDQTQQQARPDQVRLALPREALDLAAIQRRVWDSERGHPELRAAAEELLAAVDLDQMAQVWEQAIQRPQLAAQRVLVALDQSQRVVGFAVTAPSEDPDAEPGQDGLVVEMVVDPQARRQGHGSRLLNAVADTLRADGFSRATWWLRSADDGLRSFLDGAGWAPDGAHREIGSDSGVRLKQVRLHTDISA